MEIFAIQSIFQCLGSAYSEAINVLLQSLIQFLNTAPPVACEEAIFKAICCQSYASCKKQIRQRRKLPDVISSTIIHSE